MKSSIRSIRRRHKKRMKAKAEKLYYWCTNPIKYADNLALCSCAACGNPRKYNKEVSIQERKATIKERY